MYFLLGVFQIKLVLVKIDSKRTDLSLNVFVLRPSLCMEILQLNSNILEKKVN